MKPAVLQLIDSFNQGGSELQAVQLTRLLSESGEFSVHLASLNPAGPLRSQVEKFGLPELPSFPLNSFYDLNAVRQLRALSAHLRRKKIAVVHTHDFYTNVFGMAAATIARTPVKIASMRETAGMRSGSQLKAQRMAYALATHVVANSEAVRDRLVQEKVAKEKVAVVYNGLNLERLSTSSTREESLRRLGLGQRTEKQFVTIVANMRHDVKDYPMFLNAAKVVSNHVSEVGFLLAGEGELSNSFQQLAAELGIAQRTVFLGRCDQVAELLNASNVCVLSSKAEGFSNSILEYMAAGKPVVATDVGGAKEAIIEGETGYLVKSGDSEQLANRIIELIVDGEKAQLFGERGRVVVETKFSVNSQLKNTENLYKRLLKLPC